jgi:SAM-dependent methyltransferase
VTSPPSAYDELGALYDSWSRSVTEDIDFYVELAIESGGPVLEVGVGSGRIAIPTALAGLEVVGVDSSPAMLDLARAKAAVHGIRLRLVHADMRRLPELGRFPLITVPFRALLHLRTDAERLAVLRSLRSRLLDNGRLAFDVFHPDAADIAETNDRWIEREPGIFEHAVWRPVERSLSLTVRAKGRTGRMELWWAEPDDWARMLRGSGFSRLCCYGSFDRRPYAPGGTDTVWIAVAGGEAAPAAG